MDNSLSIKNLTVAVGAKEVVKGFSLTIQPGEIHALMGPNGSGKSSLASAIMGHPEYRVTGGSLRLFEEDLLRFPVEERARRGLFLSFQEPPEVGGVSMRVFISSISQNVGVQPLRQPLESLGISDSFLDRFLNDGFSGGEKKKSELLQFLARKPKFAIFDEIDSGIDIDSLRVVADTIKNAAAGGTGILLISHSPRLFSQIIPHRIHVLVEGSVAASGGPEIITSLESGGYRIFSRGGRAAEPASVV